MARSTWLWWSSGKDSAWALERLLDDDHHRVTGLVTTVDPASGRVRFQGTGSELLELQAASTGLPLHRVELPHGADDARYLRMLAEVCARARSEGVEVMAFGDLHLADVRAWRDAQLGALGLQTFYPLWGEPTGALARTMIAGGLRAVITCLDPRVLDERWLGAAFDDAFLDELPATVDPCGENGEFHTFVVAGPMLHDILDVEIGPPERDGDFLCGEPVLRWPLDGILDLHGVPPRDVGNLVDDYLDACRARGVLQVRIVHGKGIGALRETVHARLRRRSDVVLVRAGGDDAGGWGATLVTLAPAADPR